jgi:glutaredoxin
MKKEKIVIYTNEACPYCKRIKEELNNNKIEFEEKLTKDYMKEWMDVVSLTGAPTVPTIVYKNNYFVPSRDFQNEKHLIDILNNFQESSHEVSFRILESIKTLTHSMGMAFGRTDQILRQIETKLNKENEK